MAFSRIYRTTIATSAVAVLLAAGVAHSTGTRQVDRPVALLTDAQEAYPDAPYGVDPMVTGPTSTAFGKRQDAAGCAQAKWPDVPLACYPD
ncbi:hypothetical protein ABUE31_07920 [Mesorhizobium sp. ZMM04-5]|uniref:Uncharacterized protein n=1 Tax=Mesorhizobium marinum TaxID=3228790 RepID=A0ABV3QXV4_9HYPH